ncbi:MAG: serine hydrolase [bacterium]
MIIVSDNVATIEVLKLTGVESVNETAKSLDLENTLFSAPGPEVRGYATSTARELVRLMKAIIEGTAASEPACAEMQAILSRQFYLDQLPRFLPVNKYTADRGAVSQLIVRNKTGFAKGIRSDVGSFEVAKHHPLLMAAIANWQQTDDVEQSLLSEPAAILHGTLGRIAFDSMRPGNTSMPFTRYSQLKGEALTVSRVPEAGG